MLGSMLQICAATCSGLTAVIRPIRLKYPEATLQFRIEGLQTSVVSDLDLLRGI